MTLDQYPAKFGKYILLDRLNAGGMAEVFVAKASGVEGFERLVAIKCMLPALVTDSQFTAMFVDEARLAAQVAHANVVQIYELGRQAERLYIAMELVHGHDLRHIIRTAQMANVALPAAFSAYVISKAAEGLDYAHRRLNKDGSPLGLVHRDVSPQNILVSYDGEVKVVDFGIAKAAAEVRSTETQVGVLKGKFAYMAPEQVMGEAIDRRADIFALGSVLFEALSGQRLFTGDNDLVVLERVRDAVLPNLRAMLPSEAERTLPVLNRALSLLPDMRYSYASEMAEALEPMLIEDQSIFGAKRAASVMQSLYRADIEHNAALLRSYSDITQDNCVYEIGGERAGSAAPVVYESTFYGPTPAPAAVPSRVVQRRDVMPATEILTGGHELEEVPPNTSTGVRRPVTLTRRNVRPNAAASGNTGRHSLDVLAAPETLYEPLKRQAPAQASRPSAAGDAHDQATLLAQREAKASAAHEAAEAGHSRSSVRSVLWRMRILFALVTLAFVGLIMWVNLSMDEPLTVAQVRDSIQAQQPVAKLKEGVHTLLAWRPLDNWLFGHEVRYEPTAYARHLEKRAAAQNQNTPQGAPEAVHDGFKEPALAAQEDAAALPAPGYVTIKMAKNVQALVSIDGGEAVWAPVEVQPLAIGHHEVRAERHRAGGRQELRKVEFDVGPSHSQSAPLVLTLSF